MLNQIHFAFFLIGLSLMGNSLLAKKLSYKPYLVNLEPLKKYKAQYELYQRLDNLSQDGFLPADLLHQRLKSLQWVIKREPQWDDGRWILAANHIGFASTLIRPDQRETSYKHIQLSKAEAKKCLRVEPKNVLCQFFLALALGQESSIDGLLASLSIGAEIHDLFVEVSKSPYDYHFGKYGSIQSFTRDALGTYMRIVPDSVILEWIFSMRGNKEKAIQYHKEGIAIAGQNACNSIFLAVAYICYAEEVDDEISRNKLRNKGLEWILKSQQSELTNQMLVNCKDDAERIQKSPSLACGYTPLKQQEPVDEEELGRHLAH